MYESAAVPVAARLTPHESEARNVHLAVPFSLAFTLANGLTPARRRTAAVLAAAVCVAAAVLLGLRTLFGAERLLLRLDIILILVIFDQIDHYVDEFDHLVPRSRFILQVLMHHVHAIRILVIVGHLLDP